MNNKNSFVYKQRYDTALNLLVQVFEGPFDWPELLEASKQATEMLSAHPDHRPGMDCLADISRAEPQIDFDGARTAIAGVQDAPILKANRLALLASGSLQYGSARMYQSLSEGTGNFKEMKIFKEWSEAMEWLGLPDDFELGV